MSETLCVLPEWRLSEQDMLLARRVAEKRQQANRNRGNAYGATGGLDLHVEGAQAELAFARMAAVSMADWQAYVETVDLRSIPHDVAGCQVRSTKRASGRLIVHPSDVRDYPGCRYVLVINSCPLFCSPGWIMPADAQRPQWWTQPAPPQSAAWFVPQSALHPWRLCD